MRGLPLFDKEAFLKCSIIVPCPLLRAGEEHHHDIYSHTPDTQQ